MLLAYCHCFTCKSGSVRMHPHWATIYEFMENKHNYHLSFYSVFRAITGREAEFVALLLIDNPFSSYDKVFLSVCQFSCTYYQI